MRQDNIIIGSHAIKHWFPDFKRKPVDLDLASLDEKRCTKEFDISHLPEIFPYCDGDFASPQVLLTLKLSHSFWNINWIKHSSDILFLQSKGIMPHDDLLQSLYSKWELIHGKKKVPSFAVTKSEFFTQHVSRKIDHDTLHEHLKFGDTPVYKKVLKDGHEVLLDQFKFIDLSREEKINMCREEICVLAVERYPGKSHIGAYRMATRDLVTRLSKGWFPRFLMLNYLQVSEIPLHYKEYYKSYDR